MFVKLVCAGMFGPLFGAVMGWIAFNTVTSAIGFGCAMGSGLCGVIISASSKKD